MHSHWKWVWAQNKNMIYLKSASFIVIMLSHKGLTHKHSQKKKKLRLHFGKSFTLSLPVTAWIWLKGLRLGLDSSPQNQRSIIFPLPVVLFIHLDFLLLFHVGTIFLPCHCTVSSKVKMPWAARAKCHLAVIVHISAAHTSNNLDALTAPQAWGNEETCSSPLLMTASHL